MKIKSIALTIFFLFFYVSFSLAGSASLVGDWEGTARAILPDGTVIDEIELGGSLNKVDGSLFVGTFSFSYPGMSEVQAFATGDIQGQKIKGIMSFQTGPTTFQGVAFFEANLRGRKMIGIVRDLSDGSTSTFSAYRTEQ
jgi:hypothetical protein